VALVALLESGVEPPALPETGRARPLALDPRVTAQLGPQRALNWPDVRLLARPGRSSTGSGISERNSARRLQVASRPAPRT
jgi:hypothetical protein